MCEHCQNQELDPTEAAEAARRDKLARIRHSASHIMAEAVQSIFPDAKFAIGPAIADGFYYDFDLPRPLTDADLETISAKMKEIIKANVPFEHSSMSKDEARKYFGERNQTYKLELIEGETTEYGLYVKTVNGVTADYDVDQTYWAFYINGEYAMTGVDATDVEAGQTYEFRVES